MTKMLIDLPLPESSTVQIDRKLIWKMAASQALCVEKSTYRLQIPVEELNELTLLGLYATRNVRVSRDE
jgi:hypothetical protein